MLAMRYGVLFLVLGVSLAGLAALIGGAGFALLWPASSVVVVSAAYLRERPAALGKRADGTLAPSALLLLAPYLVLTFCIWWIERALSREDAADEVAPGLWVGRRPLASELPAEVGIVVDLTAELPEPAAVRRRAGYLCLPVLDGAAPAADALRGLVERLRDERGILLHCASGHGRSATVAAALMLDRGLARDVDEAEAAMRARRPGIRLNAVQRELLRSTLAIRST